MKLGTILPNRATLELGDAHADRQARKRESIGAKLLSDCERRIVGGETRYYKIASVYAVVARDNSIKWFESRTDGDYRIKGKYNA